MDVIFRIWCATPVSVRCVARFGGGLSGECNTLPFITAASVRPGMVMFTEDGGYDVVEHVDACRSTAPSTTSTSTHAQLRRRGPHHA